MSLPFTPLVAPEFKGALSMLSIQLRDYLRAALPQGDIPTVELYGGEFDEDEVSKTEYACPAVFVTCLGFAHAATARVGGKYARNVHMAAFVNTKHATRAGRFVEAADLAERVDTLVMAWKPVCPTVPSITGQPVPNVCLTEALPATMAGENLYTRKLDANKLALWLLTWQQGVVLAHGVDPATLPSLVTVHTDSTLLTAVPDAPAPAPQTLTTESCVGIDHPLP